MASYKCNSVWSFRFEVWQWTIIPCLRCFNRSNAFCTTAERTTGNRARDGVWRSAASNSVARAQELQTDIRRMFTRKNALEYWKSLSRNHPCARPFSNWYTPYMNDFHPDVVEIWHHFVIRARTCFVRNFKIKSLCVSSDGTMDYVSSQIRFHVNSMSGYRVIWYRHDSMSIAVIQYSEVVPTASNEHARRNRRAT
jgi:hypothetical protein